MIVSFVPGPVTPDCDWPAPSLQDSVPRGIIEVEKCLSIKVRSCRVGTANLCCPDCTGVNVLPLSIAGVAVCPALLLCCFPNLRCAVLCELQRPADGLCAPPAQVGTPRWADIDAMHNCPAIRPTSMKADRACPSGDRLFPCGDIDGGRIEEANELNVVGGRGRRTSSTSHTLLKFPPTQRACSTLQTPTRRRFAAAAVAANADDRLSHFRAAELLMGLRTGTASVDAVPLIQI